MTGNTAKNGVTRKKAGRPKGMSFPTEVANELRIRAKLLALKHSGEAIRTLYDLMTDPNQSGPTRVSAAHILLTRALGNPESSVAIKDPDGVMQRPTLIRIVSNVPAPKQEPSNDPKTIEHEA